MRYLAQRLLRFMLVFFIVTFGLMLLMRLGMNKPGDPARTMLGGTVSQQQIDDVTARYHLDAPIIVQYGYWLKGMLTLDMGVSVQQNLAVLAPLVQEALATRATDEWLAVFRAADVLASRIHDPTSWVADPQVRAMEIVDEELWRNPNIVKLVANEDGEVLYTSRAPIPWDASQPYKGLGFRQVDTEIKTAECKLTEFPVVKA